MASIDDAKLSAKRAYIAAETEYSEAYDAHRAVHSAAIAELVKVNPKADTDVLAWLRERTGPARERLDAAEQGLRTARAEQLAIEDAEHLQAEAAKARNNAERYADKVALALDTAESAVLLASKALMQINPNVKEVRIR